MDSVFIGKVRRIGNSYGIIVPKKELDARHVHEGDQVTTQIKKVYEKSRFGSLRGKTTPTFKHEPEHRM
ncbi:MAG: hypothetical protein ABH950_01585 [Candidatus Altiarchaeota archaeon]